MAGKFKLQSVLNYRQSLEDQAQQLLTTSLQQQKNFEEQLSCQQQTLNDADTELKLRQLEGMTIAEMDLYEGQIYHCRQVIEEIHQHLQRLLLRIEEERKALLHAARERQVLEKLKERQEAEYQQELSRLERVMLDEISLQKKGKIS